MTLWCLVGAQAASLLGVQPDLGLIVAGSTAIGLLAAAGRPLRAFESLISRRRFAASTPWLVATPLAFTGCSPEPAADRYEAVAERTWQPGAVSELRGAALGRELVRCATLVPFSHTTQCWKFALGGGGEPEANGLSPGPDGW